jgi:hypothetical protein
LRRILYEFKVVNNNNNNNICLIGFIDGFVDEFVDG